MGGGSGAAAATGGAGADGQLAVLIADGVVAGGRRAAGKDLNLAGLGHVGGNFAAVRADVLHRRLGRQFLLAHQTGNGAAVRPQRGGLVAHIGGLILGLDGDDRLADDKRIGLICGRSVRPLGIGGVLQGHCDGIARLVGVGLLVAGDGVSAILRQSVGLLRAVVGEDRGIRRRNGDRLLLHRQGAGRCCLLVVRGLRCRCRDNGTARLENGDLAGAVHGGNRRRAALVGHGAALDSADRGSGEIRVAVGLAYGRRNAFKAEVALSQLIRHRIGTGVEVDGVVFVQRQITLRDGIAARGIRKRVGLQRAGEHVTGGQFRGIGVGQSRQSQTHTGGLVLRRYGDGQLFDLDTDSLSLYIQMILVTHDLVENGISLSFLAHGRGLGVIRTVLTVPHRAGAAGRQSLKQRLLLAVVDQTGLDSRSGHRPGGLRDRGPDVGEALTVIFAARRRRKDRPIHLCITDFRDFIHAVAVKFPCAGYDCYLAAIIVDRSGRDRNIFYLGAVRRRGRHPIFSDNSQRYGIDGEAYCNLARIVAGAGNDDFRLRIRPQLGGVDVIRISNGVIRPRRQRIAIQHNRCYRRLLLAAIINLFALVPRDCGALNGFRADGKLRRAGVDLGVCLILHLHGVIARVGRPLA